MAAKRVDPLKAKQAKQKKMAIVLCVVFAAVLAFQGPKTLKMLKGPQAEAVPVAAPAAPAADPSAAPAPVPAPAAGTPVAAAGLPPGLADAQPAVLVDSDVPAAAGDGQLRSFERFQTKDPFAQQGEVTAIPAPPAKPASTPGVVVTTPTPGAGGTIVAPPPGSSGGTPPITTTGTAPAATTPALATSISVNGLAEDVAVAATFPAVAPVFALVSLGEDGKSVQIGIAGGVYADGAETIKLKVGKPLTLRNTADGSEYVLLLKAVAGFAPAAPPKQK